ncbi:MAG: hypothetical protein ABSE00_03140 [Chitinispirillaceae bacterium]
METFFTPSFAEGKENKIGDSMIKMKSLIITVMIQAIVFSACHLAYGEKPPFDFGDTLILKIKGIHIIKDFERSIIKISDSEYNVFDTGYHVSLDTSKIFLKHRIIVWAAAPCLGGQSLYLQLPIKKGNIWSRVRYGTKYTYSVFDTNVDEQTWVGNLSKCFKIKVVWFSNASDAPGMQESIYTINSQLFIVKEEAYIDGMLVYVDSVTEVIKNVKKAK